MEVVEDSTGISTTTLTNTAQLSVTAQITVPASIRVRHDVAAAAAAAAIVDVTVWLSAKTSAFYRRIHRK